MKRFTGKWFEIARLENRYERGLRRVTAQYELNEDGTLRVTNSGYDLKSGERKEAVAKARPGEAPNRLKVYFIPVIYGRYQVAWIDEDYSRAVVAGGTKDYLWLLARTARLSAQELQPMLNCAEALGYDTSELIYTQGYM